MNKFIIPILILSCSACDLSKVKSVVASLEEATADLQLPDEIKSQACEIYRQKGRELAESIWTGDWPVFAPIFTTPPSAATDLEYCYKVVTDRGAIFVTKPEGWKSSTALVFVVALAPDYASWTIERKASIVCHEAAHIVWQHRRKHLSVIDYGTVSGRLVAEGTAYALADALSERYGIPAEEIVATQVRRADNFPKMYKVNRTVNSECVASYFGDIRETLRERTGH